MTTGKSNYGQVQSTKKELLAWNSVPGPMAAEHTVIKIELNRVETFYIFKIFLKQKQSQKGTFFWQKESRVILFHLVQIILHYFLPYNTHVFREGIGQTVSWTEHN